MTQLKGKILITGGSGTLGNAIIEHTHKKGFFGEFTVFSRDPMRQAVMRQRHLGVNYVIGDVRDLRELALAAAGQDMIIHAAAMKHIPEAEHHPKACYEVNVMGSQNVIDAALYTGVKDVVLISTDKACHPINSYGCTKMMMERLGYLYAKTGLNVYMPRYGNVIDSTGSVLQVWQRQRAEGKPITFTYPGMTRFWLTPERAVEIVVASLDHPGCVYVPRLPALSIKKVADYTIGEDVKCEVVGLRPGEKIHEELLTDEESAYAKRVGMLGMGKDEAYIIRDVAGPRGDPFGNYSSDNPSREVSREEIRAMMGMEEEDETKRTHAEMGQ